MTAVSAAGFQASEWERNGLRAAGERACAGRGCGATVVTKLRVGEVVRGARMPTLCDACRLHDIARALAIAYRTPNAKQVRTAEAGFVVTHERGEWLIYHPLARVGARRPVAHARSRDAAFGALRTLLVELGVDWRATQREFKRATRHTSAQHARAAALWLQEAARQAPALGKDKARALLRAVPSAPSHLDASHVLVPGRARRMSARLLVGALQTIAYAAGEARELTGSQAHEAVCAALGTTTRRSGAMYVQALTNLKLLEHRVESLGRHGTQSTVRVLPFAEKVRTPLDLQRHVAKLFVRVKRQRHRTSEAKSQRVFERIRALAPDGAWVTKQQLLDGWDASFNKDTLQWHFRRLAHLSLIEHERHHPKGMQRGSVSRVRLTDEGKGTTRVASVYLVKPRHSATKGAQALLDRLRALAPEGEWVAREDVHQGWNVSWCRDTYQQHARHLIDLGFVEREYYAAHRGSVSRLRLTPLGMSDASVDKLAVAVDAPASRRGPRWAKA